MVTKLMKDIDSRHLWNNLVDILHLGIIWILRAVIVLLFLFLFVHIFDATLLERIGKLLHLAEPGLDSILTLAVIMIVLERIFIIEDMLRAPSDVVYRTQDKMYRELANLVEKKGAENATLIQYSCTTAMPLVKALLEANAKVTIYVQDPATACAIGSITQQDKILGHINSLQGEVQDHENNLTVRQYSTPASAAIVKIDSEVVAIGWYVYRKVDSSNRRRLDKRDSVEILAHNVPCIVAYRKSRDYSTIRAHVDWLIESFSQHSIKILPANEHES